MGYKTELELLPTSSPGEFLRSYPWDKQLKSVLNDVFKIPSFRKHQKRQLMLYCVERMSLS